ncbi:peptidase M42 [Clostridia bacterium]|nr:peptidase M42 [Clostridia bacterium]
MRQADQAYMLEQLKNLLEIDSTTGMYQKIEAYLAAEATRLGYAPVALRKGGLTVDLGGTENGLVLTAHADDIGLIVRYVNPDGSIRVINVGGLHPFLCEHANVRLYARGGRVYTGTMRRANPSLHLMSDAERTALAAYDQNFFLYLDEDVHSPDDVAALGVRCGDVIALDPATVFTPSGYIKSRFLDDKTSVAILLTFMRAVREEKIALARHVTVHFSFFEEIGHGGASGIPEDTAEVLAVDIGCCGPTHYSDEKKVSICAMDTFAPYHPGVVDALVAAAERAGVAYALDVFVPHYGSDANAALKAGLDVRHGLIGPGVLETHGYERTHVDALAATYALLRAYIA